MATSLSVTFRRMAGDSHALQVAAGQTVREVKFMLEEELGIPVLEQRRKGWWGLLHGAAILDDDAMPFAELAVSVDGEVQVVRQPRMNLEQFRKDLGHGETPLDAWIDLGGAVVPEVPPVRAEEVISEP
eukprot:Skav230866  [mRNA]  locus=scaffold1335:221366:222093:- [translate_table: standard]